MDELHKFVKEWLATWTGNQPARLLAFYTDDAFYLDPGNKHGLRGKEQLKNYFSKLLEMFPDWRWKPVEIFPTDKGLLLKWECWIPLGGSEIHEFGIDIIELREGKICRNEVYFDRTELAEALNNFRRQQRLIS